MKFWHRLSFDEFMQRMPPDQKDWKIVPMSPRPSPQQLRDTSIGASTPSLVPLPIAAIAPGGLIGAGALARRRRARKASNAML